MEYSDLIAVISLTHNHPETVKDVISNSAEYYKKHGIEIYFFDSSDNDETKEIIEGYISSGYDNMIHVSLRGLEMEDKMNVVFSGKEFRKKYKYVWPTKDRAYVKEYVLEKVIESAKKDYDIIFTISNTIDNGGEYNSAIKFYRDYASWATSVNTTIYNTRTILKDYHIVEEGYYSKGSEAFLQNAAVFEGLAQLDSPRIKIVDTSEDGICMSPYSKTMYEHSIVVWKDHWIKVNDNLPSIYDEYKAKVIKEAPSFPWILGDVDILIELKEQGKISMENLDWVLEDWNRISDIPKETIVSIVNGDYDPEHDLSLICSNDEMVCLLVKLSNLLKDNQEVNIEIPVDSIFRYFINVLSLSQVLDMNKKRIIIGSVKDILIELQQSKKNERIRTLLQEIVGYMLILDVKV